MSPLNFDCEFEQGRAVHSIDTTQIQMESADKSKLCQVEDKVESLRACVFYLLSAAWSSV